MEQVQRLDERFAWGYLSLVLTDDKGIRDLNRTYFDKDRPTDVISFAYPPMPGTDHHSGEVIVNVQRALREGEKQDGPERELALYVAHGCHHLTGASDHTDALRAEMLRQEQAWLAEAAARRLLDHLFT